MTERDPFKIGGIAFRVIGYGALAGAVYFLVVNTVFWMTAESATGKVVGWEYMNQRSVRLRPYEKWRAKATVVSFRTSAGEDVAFVTDWGSESNPYSHGDSVIVLYDQDNPENARIRSFVSLYLGPLMLLIFGAGFWFFGTLVQGFAEVTTGNRKHRR
ncbi:MAG: DUF3592 domain-containing protein [Candidatus Binatia bacterium]